MRFYHRSLRATTRPPPAPTPDDAAMPTVESHSTGMSPSHTLVLTSPASEPPAEPASTTGGDRATVKRLVAERDRACAQRDAALEEVALLRAEVRRWETHHTALLDQAIARERWEIKAVLGAILQEGLEHGARHQTPPEDRAHAARE